MPLFKTLSKLVGTATGDASPRASRDTKTVYDDRTVTVTAREAVLLTLLDEFDGELNTEQRLQKLAFLTDEQVGDDVSLYTWRKYDYGPYARQIKRDLASLESNGLVYIRTQKTFGGHTRYTYRLKEDGETVINRVHDEYDAFGTVTDAAAIIVDKYGDAPVSNLIEYVRTEHPVYWENSVYRV